MLKTLTNLSRRFTFGKGRRVVVCHQTVMNNIILTNISKPYIIHTYVMYIARADVHDEDMWQRKVFTEHDDYR